MSHVREAATPRFGGKGKYHMCTFVFVEAIRLTELTRMLNRRIVEAGGLVFRSLHLSLSLSPAHSLSFSASRSNDLALALLIRRDKQCDREKKRGTMREIERER